MLKADEPTEGYYRMRLVRGGPLVGIRIWHGPPLEPWTRDVMDRVWRWQAEADGELIELDRVWPVCLSDPIDEKEYTFLVERSRWARRNDAYDPKATPRRKTDWDDSSVPRLG
jgi:hypothetical protein